MDGLLYVVDFRPDEQKEGLAGGPGRGEVLVPVSFLAEARQMVLDRGSRIEQFTRGIDERVLFYRGAVAAVPAVDPVGDTALETYRTKGWPGLILQAEDYSTLSSAAHSLGLRIPTQEVLDARFGGLCGDVRTETIGR